MPLHKDYKNIKGEQIDLHVLVFTRPNLRNDEFQVYMGKNIIENCFDNLVIDEKTTKIFIQYPERWCNILEQRVLTSRIVKLYPNISEVRIVTHSVYIIQCTRSEQVGICDTSSEYPELGETDEILQTRYCPKYNESKGLQIFTA